MGKQVYSYTALLNNFSENLKKRRLELGLSQKELAEMVGITPKTIQNYEKKRTIPTSAVMESISIALDMGLEKMIDDNESNIKVSLVEKLEKVDVEKIKYLVMNINFSIEELNKELSKLDFLK